MVSKTEEGESMRRWSFSQCSYLWFRDLGFLHHLCQLYHCQRMSIQINRCNLSFNLSPSLSLSLCNPLPMFNLYAHYRANRGWIGDNKVSNTSYVMCSFEHLQSVCLPVNWQGLSQWHQSFEYTEYPILDPIIQSACILFNFRQYC